MSVWVEIYLAHGRSRRPPSRSTWACELKWAASPQRSERTASRSTWACELKCRRRMGLSLPAGHAPRERVSWNYRSQAQVSLPLTSRSTWACELKYTDSTNYYNAGGHAPRERVSWNWSLYFRADRRLCHAPRERVSWNFTSVMLIAGIIVTLHVSVWVEIRQTHSVYISCMSRSTWACELKFAPLPKFVPHISHAPRERVSWNDHQ